MIKIVFFGTPAFVVPVLEKLATDNRFNVQAVVTRPDKPVGREQKITPPPVKLFAQERGIKVLQPASLSLRAERSHPEIVPGLRPRDDNFFEQLGKSKPDAFVVAAYGKIIPQAILDIPRHGSINIHPSLLPKYRGPAPVQAAILNGDLTTGVTIIKLDEEMDHGPILTSYELQITTDDTKAILTDKSFKLGAEKLPDIIVNYINGEIKPVAQNHDEATYTKLIKKENGLIDWSKGADYIERMVRAYYPWPSAYGQLTTNNLQLTTKILKTRVSNEKTDSKPGTLFKTDNNELAVASGESSVLIIEELQPTGKKKMTAQEFLRGYQVYKDVSRLV